MASKVFWCVYFLFFLLPCHRGLLFNANTAAPQGRRPVTDNGGSLSSLLELLLRGGVGQMEGQTGGQSATPQNDCNIDERDGRTRKGAMTYSSGSVSLNLQRRQHPDRRVRSKRRAPCDCICVSEWDGNHSNNDTNNVHCQENICRLSSSRTETSHCRRRECKENNGTAVEQIHCCLCLITWFS